jgi:hypothetical protein
VINGVRDRRLGALFMTLVLSGTAVAAPSFEQFGNTLVMSNANVRLEYNLSAGTTDFYWKNAKKLSAFYSGIGLDSGYVKGLAYQQRSYALAGGNQVVVTATGAGLPDLREYFTLDESNSFLVRVEATGAHLRANWMGPIVVDAAGGVDLGVTNDLRALWVPFDNDGFQRYNAMPINSTGIGYEVAAFYDNVSRNGLVAGAVTHDTWKTGIYFCGASNQLNQLNVYGGAKSTWDVMPHGYMAGQVISSPVIFVGFGDDWRQTMQDYAAKNLQFAPRLSWTNGVPFGWNSWGVLQKAVSHAGVLAVSDFFRTNVNSGGLAGADTVYINLDAFWENLNQSQLADVVRHCHANGQHAGIYFCPFAYFGSATDTNRYVEGTSNAWRYSDVLLRDGSGHFESVDGGLAMDPTHPGTRQRIQHYINLFTNWGFDYVKVDFLSHGALEGVHYDTNVTTGIQAYNRGMQDLLRTINGTMFISESIAPLFPYQYGHSRRIACDAQASRIDNTEYTMNSVTGGWWLSGLYQFNDPDVMVFGHGADGYEQQSRLISGAVTGIFLDGDDLTSPTGRDAAGACLGHAAINAVARAGQTFLTMEENSGNAAEDVFLRPDGTNWLIAIFNYASVVTNKVVSLVRAGLPAGTCVVTNLWDGSAWEVTNTLSVALEEKQSKLFRLAPVALPVRRP